MSDERIEFFIPMKIPTTTAQQRAVHVVKGKPHFYEPPRLAQARGKFMSKLAIHRPTAKFQGPLRLVVKWLYATKEKGAHGQYKDTKPDTDNLIKLLKDVMTDLGFWNDDAQVASEINEKLWTNGLPGLWISVRSLVRVGNPGENP